MKSNAGEGGIRCDFRAEFRAYDRLPRAVRQALQTANVKWSAQDVLVFRRKHSIKETVDLIAWADAEFARRQQTLGEAE